MTMLTQLQFISKSTMRIIILMIITIIGICKTTQGQTLIGHQDFDGTVTLGAVIGGVNGTIVTGSSAAGDRPASSTFYSSVNTAASVTNGSGTVTTSNVSGLGSYVSKYFEFRLASWSLASTTNGADGADIVTVAISTDGGTSYSNELTIAGNSNAYWHYSTGTGVATVTYDGDNAPTAFAPAGGANRTTDGYSTVRINLPDPGTQARLRITLLNNAAAERWTVDDIKIFGTAGCTSPTTQASSFSATSITSTGMTLNWTSGNGDGRIVVVKAGSAVNTDPTSGTTYTPNTIFGSGSQLGTGNYVVYDGTGSSVAITGLSANTTYHVAVYEYSTTGQCYNLVELIGNATTCTNTSISSQPSTSTQTVCNGSATTSLSVTAAGTSLTYQWYSNAANSNSGGTLIAGATSASYTPSNSLIGTTYYYCEVAGTCGNVTSNVSGGVTIVSLPADPAGTITPAANPACTSTTLSYSAGSATTYWQTASLGTSTAQNTLTNYTASASGTYYVRTYNGTCWSAGQVTSAAITINTTPSITGNPSAVSTSVGTTVTFTVSATGTGLTYQWYEDQGSGFVSLSNGGVYSGVGTATLTLTSVTLGMSTYQYQCVVSGTCAPSATSSSAILTVVTTAVGDYRTIASGNWGVNTTWEKWNGAAWVACGGGDFPDVSTASATIRNGHTVDNDGAGTPPWDVKNLTVEAGGKVWDNAFTGANSYIQIYGNIVCDGTIGTPVGDDISFDIAGGTNCTISGSGSFTATRIRKDAAISPGLDVNLTIDMNILLTWNSASGTVLYNDGSTSNYNVTVNAGKTLRGTAPGSNVGNIAIDGSNFAAPDVNNAGGTYTVYGTIDVDGYVVAFNNNTTAGRSCNYVIKTGGVIKCRYIRADASASQGNSITIESGGKLNLFGSVDTSLITPVDTTWRNFSTTNNTYDFQPGSIIEYSGAPPQRLNWQSN